MKVLMFGWEFPPYSSGGLGTACYGLTKSLSKKNISITFVLPFASDLFECSFMNLIPTNLKLMPVKSILGPYLNLKSYKKAVSGKSQPKIYGDTLFDEVERYAEEAKRIALEEDFDVIHCHDWMTFKAGINAKKLRNKPLITHVHSTEFDRTGGNYVNQCVYDIEKEGMQSADAVIAVSNLTKSKIIHHYGINPEKVEVVYNAVEFKNRGARESFEIKKHGNIILYLGRLTLQKGPEYFLEAAKKVLSNDPDVKFIMAGSGNMEQFIIEKSAELGISRNILFAGFLSGDDVDRMFRIADLYVMPSVSEPFGITALESMRNGTPVLISKQSGVSEVIKHCLIADFWDIDDLANKILATIKYKALKQTLVENTSEEIKKFTWDNPAGKCIEIYNKL